MDRAVEPTRTEPRYQSGFGNHFASEALPGALPLGRNSPQRCAYGLYAEQFSGTAFTAPRHANRRSWLYRIRPAAVHGSFRALEAGAPQRSLRRGAAPPNRLRWSPMPHAARRRPTSSTGLAHPGRQRLARQHSGCAVHWYGANRAMGRRFFYDADGELLHRAAAGSRCASPPSSACSTSAPLEIAVLPRGMRFRVELPDGAARGYVCENFGAPLRLPELGPIGSNGLANPRDFLTPAAAYEDRDGEFELVAKFGGGLWSAPLDHSPLDVVAWHGNHAPYKYDLRCFNTIGTVSFDHPDPSIFLVLQSPSATRPAWTTSTSSSSRRAGWRWRTRSARPGSTATSPANAWDSSTAPTTPRRKASSPAAPRCTTA